MLLQQQTVTIAPHNAHNYALHEYIVSSSRQRQFSVVDSGRKPTEQNFSVLVFVIPVTDTWRVKRCIIINNNNNVTTSRRTATTTTCSSTSRQLFSPATSMSTVVSPRPHLTTRPTQPCIPPGSSLLAECRVVRAWQHSANITRSARLPSSDELAIGNNGGTKVCRELQ